MNHISFEIGDRVRHKITQIQAEVVQLEESLAMPHVWVIEPSQREVNPPKLYRIIDLEKVESGGKKTNNQAQCVNLNLSRGIQELEVDTSTSKQFPPDKSIDFTTISLSDRKPRLDTLTSKEILEESVLTVAHEEITVSTKLELQDLTVLHETTTVSTTDQLQDLTVENQTATVSTLDSSSVLTVETQNLTISHKAITVSTKIESQDLTVSHKATLQSESVRSEQIVSKLLPITVRISSNTTDITSTSNELVTKQNLTVEHNSTTVSTTDRFPILTLENDTTTVGTKDQFPVLTVENQKTTVSTTNRLQDLTVENDTTTVSTNQICNKRRKGKGTGRIQLRTITKPNGKQYQQFWYDWQVHTSEKTTYKSVYIPKRLLKKIQALESAKAPVWEILEVLGVFKQVAVAPT